MEPNALLQAALAWHRVFEDRPPDAHLCCPKIDEEDFANYDEPNVPDEGGLSVKEKQGEAATKAATTSSLVHSCSNIHHRSAD